MFSVQEKRLIAEPSVNPHNEAQDRVTEAAESGTLSKLEEDLDREEMMRQPTYLLRAVISTLEVMLGALEDTQPKTVAISLGRRAIASCRTELAVAELDIDPRPHTGGYPLGLYPATEEPTARNTATAVDRVEQAMDRPTETPVIDA